MINILVLISLFIFYALFVGRAIILYKQGIKIWAAGANLKVIFQFLRTILIALAALSVPMPNAISQIIIEVHWLKYIGIIFCYLGLIIFYFSLISFGKNFRTEIDVKNNPNELVTTGIFKYSRNPMYVFMYLYYIGVMLIYPNILFMVILVYVLISFHLHVLKEEKYLLNIFGDQYIQYKKQTRRYI